MRRDLLAREEIRSDSGRRSHIAGHQSKGVFSRPNHLRRANAPAEGHAGKHIKKAAPLSGGYAIEHTAEAKPCCPHESEPDAFSSIGDLAAKIVGKLERKRNERARNG